MERKSASKSEKQKAKRVRRKRLLIKALGGKCRAYGCNVTHYECLTFHHVMRYQYLKRFEIRHNNMTHSKEALLKEAEICMLLCHNCHARVHAGTIKEPKFKRKPVKIDGKF